MWRRCTTTSRSTSWIGTGLSATDWRSTAAWRESSATRWRRPWKQSRTRGEPGASPQESTGPVHGIPLLLVLSAVPAWRAGRQVPFSRRVRPVRVLLAGAAVHDLCRTGHPVLGQRETLDRRRNPGGRQGRLHIQRADVFGGDGGDADRSGGVPAVGSVRG